jgi:hypothetical protein
VIPGFGDFDLDRPLSDPASYRVLRWPGEVRLREGMDQVIEQTSPTAPQAAGKGLLVENLTIDLSNRGIFQNFFEIVNRAKKDLNSPISAPNVLS